MEKELFTHNGWDQHDTLCFGFYDVKFKKKFGVFKKGESFDSVCLEYDRGILEAYDKEGRVVKKQKIGFIAVD